MEMLVSEPSPGSAPSHPHSPAKRRSLTLSLDLPLGTSSNFPSPSSSFLPPPIPGSDEFAIKRPPRSKANSRKSSLVAAMSANSSPIDSSRRQSAPDATTLAHSNPNNTGSKTNTSEGDNTHIPPPIPVSNPTASLAVNGKSPASTMSASPSPTTPTPAISSTTPPHSATPSGLTSSHSASPSLNATPTTSFPQTPYPHPPATPASAKRLSTQSTRSSVSSPPQSPASASFSHHLSHRLSNGVPVPMTPSKMYYQLQQRNDSTTSLQSNRPAPPSPAVSRRTSGIPGTPGTSFQPSSSPASELHRRSESQTSFTSSSGLERTSSNRSTSGTTSALRRKSSGLSKDIISAVTPSQADEPEASKGTVRQQKRPKSITTSAATPATTTTSTAQRKWNPIIIRDFAFSEDDERSKGLGPDCPKPNRLRTLNKPLYVNRASMMSAMTTASSTTSSRFKFDVDDDGGPPLPSDQPTSTDTAGAQLGISGFDIPGFKWGRWSWALKRDVEEAAQHHASLYTSDDEDNQGDEEGNDGLLAIEDPLYPGLYRALYAFEPDPGSAEMGLEEGQIVRVVGRGGGPGWVVVVNDDGPEVEEMKERHALVPESYLELVELDEWEDDDELEEGRE